MAKIKHNIKHPVVPILISSLISVALIILAASYIVMRGDESAPADKVTVNNAKTIITTDENKPIYGLPVRLIIPKINVDVSVEHMGLTASGNMESPNTNNTVGWYKYGPQPGNKGSAVIAGHFGLNNNAVFERLNQLIKGDTVSVIDDLQQTVSFIVVNARTYKYDESAEEVFNNISGTFLNLITCYGDWDYSQDSFAERLVVFAEKIGRAHV